jgi:transcriptional regulator GlxA family with amidase domain
MNRAKILLKTTDLKISQISQQVGYKHPTHFAGAFKRFFGYIPNMVRCLGFYLADSLELFILGEELLLPF